MMRLIVILLFISTLFAQEGIEQLIENIQLGETEESLSALPALTRDFPNHAGVMYLAALLETDGDKAREQYQQLYKQLFETYPQENKIKLVDWDFLPSSSHIFLLNSSYRDSFLFN